MKSITLIAARDRQGAIGRGNALPWQLPADLRRFRALTLGHVVLMGRRTAESIGRPLPGRTNLVLTRAAHAPFTGQQAVDSLDAALACVPEGGTLMVIGGGEIYRQTLARADRLELTEVDTCVDGADTWFPSFEEARWQEIACEQHPADTHHSHAFAFQSWRRR